MNARRTMVKLLLALLLTMAGSCHTRPLKSGVPAVASTRMSPVSAAALPRRASTKQSRRLSEKQVERVEERVTPPTEARPKADWPEDPEAQMAEMWRRIKLIPRGTPLTDAVKILQLPDSAELAGGSTSALGSDFTYRFPLKQDAISGVQYYWYFEASTENRGFSPGDTVYSSASINFDTAGGRVDYEGTASKPDEPPPSKTLEGPGDAGQNPSAITEPKNDNTEPK